MLEPEVVVPEDLYTGLTEENYELLYGRKLNDLTPAVEVPQEYMRYNGPVKLIPPYEQAWNDTLYLHAVAPKEQLWLVDGLIPEGDVSFFTGDFGSFKSYLAWFLADAVDRGIPFLDRATRQHPVLIMDLENSHATASLRRYKVGNLASKESKVKFMGKFSQKGRQRAFPFTGKPDHFRQQDPEILRELEANQKAFNILLQVCQEIRPVIILDSFGDFHPGLDENAADDMTVFMRRLLQLVEAGSPAVICLHHVPKNTENGRGSTYRGSTAIPALAGCLLKIRKEKKTGVKITGIKNRDGEDCEIHLQMQFMPDQVTYKLDTTIEDRDAEIIRRYNEGNTQAALAEEFNLSQPLVSKIVNKHKKG